MSVLWRPIASGPLPSQAPGCSRRSRCVSLFAIQLLLWSRRVSEKGDATVCSFSWAKGFFCAYCAFAMFHDEHLVLRRGTKTAISLPNIPTDCVPMAFLVAKRIRFQSRLAGDQGLSQPTAPTCRPSRFVAEPLCGGCQGSTDILLEIPYFHQCRFSHLN